MLYLRLSYTSSQSNRVPADNIVNPILKTSARHGFTCGGYLAFMTASFANYSGAKLLN